MVRRRTPPPLRRRLFIQFPGPLLLPWAERIGGDPLLLPGITATLLPMTLSSSLGQRIATASSSSLRSSPFLPTALLLPWASGLRRPVLLPGSSPFLLKAHTSSLGSEDRGGPSPPPWGRRTLPPPSRHPVPRSNPLRGLHLSASLAIVRAISRGAA